MISSAVATPVVAPFFGSLSMGAAVADLEGGESFYTEAVAFGNFTSDPHPRAVLFSPTGIGPFGCGGSSGVGRSHGMPPQGPSGGDGNGKGGVMRVRIGDLMETSGVGFGTSGARGPARKMTDMVCFAYSLGFLQYEKEKGDVAEGGAAAVAGDLRPSTDRIMRACAMAVRHSGLSVENLGLVPSPASAYFGIVKGMPVINVTGSHIPVEPEEMNGIKYNKVAGEVLKDDEAAIKKQVVEIPTDLFDENGMFVEGVAEELPEVNGEAESMFVRRYIDGFGDSALAGKRIGLYQHSAVGRDMFKDMLEALGADVTVLGRSEKFIPVDTEAIRPEDVKLAGEWAEEYEFEAIVSTDGDSDRPLLAGRDGKWLRGDVLGILVAKYLGADSVSAPVSCNTALEKSGFFKEVSRTRIGSPYVIASMIESVVKGNKKVVSYEANGGFLTATDFEVDGRTLKALPTRDAFLPILAAIKLADREGKSGVDELVAGLPQRFTASDRLKEFPTERSREILAMFKPSDWMKKELGIGKAFVEAFGEVEGVDYTDGVRITFKSGNVVHLRPSGNAPEFRVYTEAATEKEAKYINNVAFGIIESMR
jgi:phosphomannomutase